MAMRYLRVSYHSYSLSDWRNQCLMLGDTEQTKKGGHNVAASPKHC